MVLEDLLDDILEVLLQEDFQELLQVEDPFLQDLDLPVHQFRRLILLQREKVLKEDPKVQFLHERGLVVLDLNLATVLEIMTKDKRRTRIQTDRIFGIVFEELLTLLANSSLD